MRMEAKHKGTIMKTSRQARRPRFQLWENGEFVATLLANSMEEAAREYFRRNPTRRIVWVGFAGKKPLACFSNDAV